MAMKDKVVVITGATNGIGEVAAGEIARMGARVTILGRSAERCGATAARIKAATGKSVETLVADFSSRAEVERAARELKGRLERLDVLVNNAGAVFLDRRETADGLEQTFALNHMAYFTFTMALLDLLRASAPARIVNVSSDAHKGGAMKFDDLQMKQGFSGWGAYCQSKLANVLFTTELAKKLEGTGVTVNALHPGVVSTNFGTDNGWKGKLIKLGFKLFGITPERGARTITYLATSPEVATVSGRYFYKEKEARTSAAANDAAAARRLWEISDRLAGASAPTPA